MFGAVAAGAAAGGYDSIVEASRQMAHLGRGPLPPGSPATTRSTTSSTREYVRLHDLFGRGGDDVMRTLKAIQRRVGGEAPPP